MRYDQLTIVIPVKNEEKNIDRCLKCIGNFAPVVVVDSSSTDNTVQIAKVHGARVVNFKWNGRFPKKKNWVLRQNIISTQWILFLDADEYLTESFKSEIKSKLPTSEQNGYWLNYHNHFMGKRLVYGIPFRKLFLMRLGKGEFQRIDDEGWTSLDMEVHEQLAVSGPTSEIKSPIIHENYKGLAHFISKHNEYSTWEAKRHLSANKFVSTSIRQKLKNILIDSYLLGPIYFLADYLLFLGFMNGGRGLVFSIMKAHYFFEVKLKLNELKINRTESIKDS